MTGQPRTIAPLPDGASRLGLATGWDGRQDYIGQGSGPKILGLGRAILRRARLLIVVLVVLNAAALWGVRGITPRYTASADLIVGPREEQVVDLKAVLSGLSGSSDVIESEIQVLRSREIARGVVEKLNLDQMPEFNPTLRPPGSRREVERLAGDAVAWARDEIGALRDAAGLSSMFGDAAPGPVAPPPAPAPADVSEPLDPLSVPVDRFLAQLDVTSKGRSRVITVAFTSTNATLAAKVPNAVADAYIANQLLAKTNATAQATKWLDERVAELREQVLAADEAVESYRRRAGIVPIRDSTLLAQQISEASQELMRAKEQVAIAESRMSSMATVNPNAFGLRGDVATAQARQTMLEANLKDLQRQIDIGSQSEIGLRALQREADADRNLYDKLLARARETKVQSGLQQADATIISRAERPGDPSFPKPAIILPLFFVASCIVALLLVIWLESLDRGFASVEQLEAVLGLGAVGAIPRIRQRFLRGSARISTYCLDHPRSKYAEAIRNLHTSLMLSGKEQAPRTILFASALPEEGKSSAVLAMARMMASYGKRVIAIDCDLRKPTLHKTCGVGNRPGLAECLAGHGELEAAIRMDIASTAYLLPAGGSSMTAPDLFGSSAMRGLLEQLSKSFDLILLDGAPVLGVSDTRHLSRLADATVFLVRWQNTRCAAAAIALRQLLDAGANVAGTLLTMVDPKHYRRYSPAGPYHRQLRLYLNP